MVKYIPNILTGLRIIIIPVIIALYYGAESSFWRQFTAILFAITCITDFLDGHLARIWSIQSSLGKILDPIADKLLVGSVIIAMVDQREIDVVPAIAIICREILVSGLREFLAEIKVSLPVSNLAKIKTAVQMFALFIVILGSQGSSVELMPYIGRVLIWVSAALTIITGYAYVKAGWQYIKD